MQFMLGLEFAGILSAYASALFWVIAAVRYNGDPVQQTKFNAVAAVSAAIAASIAASVWLSKMP